MTAVPLSMNPSPLAATQKLIFVNALFCVLSVGPRGACLWWVLVCVRFSFRADYRFSQKVVIGVWLCVPLQKPHPVPTLVELL